MWFSSWFGKRRYLAPSARDRWSPRKAPRCWPRLETLEDRWLPSQVGLTVTSLADAGAGTLRAAIQTADAGSPSNKFTIGFSVAGTIDLQTPLPNLSNSIAIEGPGASSLTVERAAGASFASAIVTVDAGQTATVSRLTIANGNEGGIFNNGGTLTVANSAVVNNTLVATFQNDTLFEGSGIDNNGGTLTVANSAVVNNAVFSGPSPTFSFGLGGGIFNNSGTLTISGSTISGNFAQGSSSSGGGIYNNAGNATVTGSTLAGSSAAFGGGIFNNGMLTVRSGTLSGNSATEGGAIWNNATLTVSSSTLSGNSASDLGGAILDAGFALTVSGSAISNNSAAFGGGIWISGGSPTITGSTLSGNSAHVSGGAIFNDFGNLTVSGCTISANSATHGGGISTGNSGVVGGTIVSTVRDSVFTGNSATDGGAIYNANGLNSSLDVRGSTFMLNTAGDSGGGIYNLGTATLKDCTVSDNTAGSGGGGIFNAATGTLTIDDSTVCDNVAALGADLDDLGVATINDSDVCVIGP